jgi:hypothetical protein
MLKRWVVPALTGDKAGVLRDSQSPVHLPVSQSGAATAAAIPGAAGEETSALEDESSRGTRERSQLLMACRSDG